VVREVQLSSSTGRVGPEPVPVTDGAIATAAAVIGLPVAASYLPGVRANLALLAGHADILLAPTGGSAC